MVNWVAAMTILRESLQPSLHNNAMSSMDLFIWLFIKNHFRFRSLFWFTIFNSIKLLCCQLLYTVNVYLVSHDSYRFSSLRGNFNYKMLFIVCVPYSPNVVLLQHTYICHTVSIYRHKLAPFARSLLCNEKRETKSNFSFPYFTGKGWSEKYTV